MKITSKEANKFIKTMNEKLEDLIEQDKRDSVYVAAIEEDPMDVRPDYDFSENADKEKTIMKHLVIVKHALNRFNQAHKISPDEEYTIDQVLVMMPILSRQIGLYREMMKLPEKARANDRYRSNPHIEYNYTNFDRGELLDSYDTAKEQLEKWQLQLDRINSTVEEIDIPDEIALAYT